MDVSTRWDSTGMMMIRAMRLRHTIDIYCSEEHKARHFRISNQEWTQIGYLIDLVRPFNFFTTTVGKTKSVTLCYGLRVYDELYERINECRRKLKEKRNHPQFDWVSLLIESLDAAEAKLDQYYNKMYGNIGSIYAMGAILDPSLKLEAFNEDYCWLDTRGIDWKMEFETQFRNLFQQSYSHKSSSAERLAVIRETNVDPLALMLNRSRYTRENRWPSSDQVENENGTDEIDRWFATSKFYTNFYTNLS